MIGKDIILPQHYETEKMDVLEKPCSIYLLFRFFYCMISKPDGFIYDPLMKGEGYGPET